MTRKAKKQRGAGFGWEGEEEGGEEEDDDEEEGAEERLEEDTGDKEDEAEAKIMTAQFGDLAPYVKQLKTLKSREGVMMLMPEVIDFK